MKKLLAIGCLLLMAGVVNAAPTTVEDLTPIDVSPANTFGYYHWVYQGNLNWTHTVDFGPAPVPGATLDLLSASLTISATDVDAEKVAIKTDGAPAGNLATGPTGSTTISTFIPPDDATLEALLLDGTLVVQAIPSGDLGERFKLNSSKLSVTYDWILPPPPPPDPPQPPAVPAPAGLVLAGIGTVVIGWFKRRQYL